MIEHSDDDDDDDQEKNVEKIQRKRNKHSRGKYVFLINLTFIRDFHVDAN
jgi:hypothetical protein